MLNKLALIGLAIACTAASTGCPTRNATPTLMCSDFSLYIRPGSCTAFVNPCNADGVWLGPGGSRSDHFGVEGLPATVYAHEETANGTTSRSLCAAAGAGDIVSQSLVFTYEREAFYPLFDPGFNFLSPYGTGHVTLTVATPLVATATASPAHVRPGETSQLVVSVSGGVPPYSYSWIPTSGLSVTNWPTPVASPASDTMYEVTVTDSAGQPTTASVAVAVDVDFEILASANPAVTNPGDWTQLYASLLGGRPPYTFSWSPGETLDDPASQYPLASPRTTTTYTVVATGGDGVSLTGSVQVQVYLLLMSLTATPASVLPGQKTQLDAGVVGGDGVYTYVWSPTAGLSDPNIRNPIAAPVTSTDYQITITDGHGLSTHAVVHVTVTAATANAAFSFLRGALDPVAHTIRWTFDASASSVGVTSYAWDLHGNDGTVFHSVSGSPVLEIDLPESAQKGTMTLTVATANGQTATATLSYR